VPVGQARVTVVVMGALVTLEETMAVELLFGVQGLSIGTMVCGFPTALEIVQRFGQAVMVTHWLAVALYVFFPCTHEVGVGQKVM
jgi:Cys-tRNA synthase (O-phospho-L-seryl-tRNA:Cys-tRNA synthase)